MTAGLYPPEGTEDETLFYLRGPAGSHWPAQWNQGRWEFLYAEMNQPATEMVGWTLVCRIPDPADLLRQEQRVQELLEANNQLVKENRVLRAALAHSTKAIEQNIEILRGMRLGPLVMITRQDGKPLCGECCLQPGEVCDICGAQAEPPPVDQGAHIQAYAEGSAAAMAGVDWSANPYRQPALGAEWNRGWQEQVKARVARELDDGVITRDEAARWLEGGWPHEPAPERQGPRSQGDAATPLASGNADTARPGASPAA